MLLNDRPRYPMVFEFYADLSGILDQEALDHAVQQVVRRQALFRCHGMGRPFKTALWFDDSAWSNSKFQFRRVHRIDEAQLRPRDEYRLSFAPFLNIWVSTPERSSHVIFQFHHVVVDGLGAMQFIREVLHEYHHIMTNDDSDPLPPPAYEQLPQRADVSKVTTVTSTPLERIRSFVREAVLVLRQRPTPLASPPDDGAEQRPIHYGELLTIAFTPEQTAAYRRQATQLHVSTNDLLMTHFFAALAEWQQEHGYNDTACIRVTMPVAHHHRVSPALPICNRIGFAFLTRRIHDIVRRAELLAGIANETRLIRKFNLADNFAAFLQHAGRIPGLMRHFTNEKKCFSTAIFSNMGDIGRHSRLPLPREDGRLVAGNLRLEKLVAAPPLQANTRLAVCAICYAGRLYLSFRFDGDHFTYAAATEFAAKMRRIMDEPIG